MIVGLPSLWRLEYENATGEDVKVTVQYRTQKLTSGALEYGTWQTPTDDDTLSDGASGYSDTDDEGHENTSALALGAEVWWSITTPSTGTIAADGLFTIRLQTGEGSDPADFQQAGDGIIVATAYVKTDVQSDVISGHFSI